MLTEEGGRIKSNRAQRPVGKHIPVRRREAERSITATGAAYHGRRAFVGLVVIQQLRKARDRASRRSSVRSFLVVIVSAPLTMAMAQSEAAPRAWLGHWKGVATSEVDSIEAFVDFVADEKDPSAVDAVFHLPVTHIRDLALGKISLDAKTHDFVASGFRFTPLGSDAIDATFHFGDRDLAMHFVRADGAPPEEAPHGTSREVAPRWTFEAKSTIFATCAIGNGLVVVGDTDGVVHALSIEKGEERWKYDTGDAIYARAAVTTDRVFVPDDDGTLFALDAKNGALVWKTEIGSTVIRREPPGPTSKRFDTFGSGPVVVDGTLYVGGSDGTLRALTVADGHEIWSFKAKDAVHSSPAFADGRVFFGSYDGAIYAVNAKDGSLAWKVESTLPITSSPTVTDGTVYIGGRDANFSALDAATGALRWRRYCWLSWVESSATIEGDTVYIGSSDNQRLLALDTSTGVTKWSFLAHGWAWTTPAIHGDRVFLGTEGSGPPVLHLGAFFALDRVTGKELWHASCAPIDGAYLYGYVSSPVVAGDRVVIAGLDGIVRCFAADD